MKLWAIFVRTMHITPYPVALVLVLQLFLLENPFLSVIESGFVILLIALFVDHRQKTFFEADPTEQAVEECVRGGNLNSPPFDQLISARAWLSRLNYPLIMLGTIFNGMGCSQAIVFKGSGVNLG